MAILQRLHNPAFMPQPTTTLIGRDGAIDTIRGVAILMVIGIHALQQPLDSPWKIALDALLRPCVPLFLFASGYLTGLSGRVPVAKRLMATLIPYAIAFVAAYLYMALKNPAMDHRLMTIIARFVLAYVFVYYYVFVYIACTFLLWFALWLARRTSGIFEPRLQVILPMSIGFGLLAGSYGDATLAHFGLSDGTIDEFRLRDIPFWFGFAALGMLMARLPVRAALSDMRLLLTGAAIIAYAIYTTVRVMAIGDAAAYDSSAFFIYAATLCMAFLAMRVDNAQLATLGSGSYFLYLWHIFIIMELRDLGWFGALDGITATSLTYVITIIMSVLALTAIRRWFPARLIRYLGA